MKQRLLVMNGQRIVQVNNESGVWINHKVDKARALKPGIYNLYMAKEADKLHSYDGMIVHTDRDKIYQQIAQNFIMHSKLNFDIVPDIGSVKRISYGEQGKAIVIQIVQFGEG